MWIVTQLQPDFSLDRLRVGNTSFGLDPCPPRRRIGSVDVRVPRAQIAVNRKRHFDAPAKARMQRRPKSLQKRQLSSISDRVPCRVRSQRKIQPNDRAPGAELRDRDARDGSVLEAPKAGVRCARGRRDVAQAQSRTNSSEPMICRDPTHCIPGTPSATLRRPFPCSHRGRVSPTPLTWQLRLASGREVRLSLWEIQATDAAGPTVDSSHSGGRMERWPLRAASRGAKWTSPKRPDGHLERCTLQAPLGAASARVAGGRSLAGGRSAAASAHVGGSRVPAAGEPRP